jgi:hypothetical protein
MEHKKAEPVTSRYSFKSESSSLQASRMNLDRRWSSSEQSRWNFTPIPLCVDHTVSAVLERETVLEWI